MQRVSQIGAASHFAGVLVNEGVVFLCVADVDGVFAAALDLVGHIAHEVAGLPDGPAIAGLHLIDGKAYALHAHRRQRGADVAGDFGKDGGAVVGKADFNGHGRSLLSGMKKPPLRTVGVICV